MAVICDTTMSPSKLELLTAWPATRPWYAGAGPVPALARPRLSATWRLPEGSRVRGVLATARYAPQAPEAAGGRAARASTAEQRR